jgi:hypothetical protein
MKHLSSKIIVDTDTLLDYEVNGPGKKILNAFLLPILNNLPIKSRSLIKKSHKSVRDIVDSATSHKALEILYKKGIKEHTQNLFSSISHAVWFNTSNSKAARNRLKLVKRELERACKIIVNKSKSLNIVSIAAGSARAVLETIYKLDIPDGFSINLTFIDKNPSALHYSKEIYQELGLNDRVNIKAEWKEDTVNGFLNGTQEKFDIVEMVGLMDYFSDEKALQIFQKIENILNSPGFFITANINANNEMKFVTKAIGWPMIYRKAEEIAFLVEQSGFENDLMDIYYEPLKIHSVVVAKK